MKLNDSEREQEENRYVVKSADRNYKYHVAVIDYLQEWNCNKKTERFLKTFFVKADPLGLSAMEPAAYQERFYRFIRDEVFTSK